MAGGAHAQMYRLPQRPYQPMYLASLRQWSPGARPRKWFSRGAPPQSREAQVPRWIALAKQPAESTPARVPLTPRIYYCVYVKVGSPPQRRLSRRHSTSSAKQTNTSSFLIHLEQHTLPVSSVTRPLATMSAGDPPEKPPQQQQDDATTATEGRERRESMSQHSETSQTAADFLRDQMQLEADAREALPYVCSISGPPSSHLSCSRGTCEIHTTILRDDDNADTD
jgi:hypothetical protein